MFRLRYQLLALAVCFIACCAAAVAVSTLYPADEDDEHPPIKPGETIRLTHKPEVRSINGHFRVEDLRAVIRVRDVETHEATAYAMNESTWGEVIEVVRPAIAKGAVPIGTVEDRFEAVFEARIPEVSVQEPSDAQVELQATVIYPVVSNDDKSGFDEASRRVLETQRVTLISEDADSEPIKFGHAALGIIMMVCLLGTIFFFISSVLTIIVRVASSR